MNPSPDYMIHIGSIGLAISGLFVVGSILFGGTPAARKIRLTKKQFFTGNELEFSRRIEKALVGVPVKMHGQVSMGALIDLQGVCEKTDPGLYYSIRRQFAGKIVDYVITCQKTGKVLCLIELDDRTHNVEKDAARDRMTRSAGYRTIRWDSRSKPSVSQIRQTIEALVPA